MDEDERNYCCLVLLLSRVGVEKLRQYFITQWNSAGTFAHWTDSDRNGKDLLRKFKPLPYEKDKVKSGDTTRWDLSLLVKALLKSRPPFVTIKSSVSSLECLKETRNKLCHTPDGKIATAEFNKLWSDVCNALAVVGATKEDFKKVKQDVKQPRNKVTSLMKHCAQQDDAILRGLNTINTRLIQLQTGQEKIKQGQSGLQQGQQDIKQGQSGLQQGQEDIKQGQSGLQQGQQKMREEMRQSRWKTTCNCFCFTSLFSSSSQGQDEVYTLSSLSRRHSKLSAEEVKMRYKYLKASIKRLTEYQPKFMASHSISSARTDEIFTNLLMQYGRKPLAKGADTSRREKLSEYSKLSGIPIERCQDIFISQEKDRPNPKSILVTGKPGIGKTLFCQKMVRDFADDRLFQEEASSERRADFEFVYLISFRQLNLLGDQTLNFQEILNRFSFVDEHSNIDEPLFEYIIDHPEKVLFILDGYDEYAQRECITSDRIEQRHESNPRVAMPVAALLSKLLKKKIFGDAVVMVTSRPSQADELGGMNFEALLEIEGFSPEQVKEFIGKFFRSNNQMKKDVLKHIMNNENLLSLAHIPFLCYLICWCLEWHIESKTYKELPVTLTELYSEVVEIFELKHHSMSEYRSEQIPQAFQVPSVVKTTMEKLSDIAVETMKKMKFNFEEEDLQKVDLISKEIESLKASGLITCGPGLRTSATQVTRHYCFSHLTLHEYFTARWYVDNQEIPSLQEIESEMVFQFIAGLAGKESREELMEGLLITLKTACLPLLLSAKCLLEYGDKEFGVKMIERGELFFGSNNHTLNFTSGFKISMLSDTDCQAIVFVLDLLNLFCRKNKTAKFPSSPSDYSMILGLSPSMSGTKGICEALTSTFCPITKIMIGFIYPNSEPFEYFLKALAFTNIKILDMLPLQLYALDTSRLSNALLDVNCKVEKLTLYGMYMYIHPSIKSFIEEFKVKKPNLRIEFKNVDDFFD